MRLARLRLRVCLLLSRILVGLGVLRVGLLLLLTGRSRLGLLLRLRLGFGLGRGLLDRSLLWWDDWFGLVRRRVDLLLAFRPRCGHVDAQSPLHLTVQTEPFLHLSEMWVGVESTLVADRGLTLGAGVVVGDRRWVGQLCGGADRTELTAGHRGNLRQRSVRRGGGQTAVRRHRRRPPRPGSTARSAEVHLEVSAGGMLTRTLAPVDTLPGGGPTRSVTHARTVTHPWTVAHPRTVALGLGHGGGA